MVLNVEYKNVKGKKSLNPDELRNFKKFVEKYKDILKEKYIDIQIRKKKINKITITKKIK